MKLETIVEIKTNVALFYQLVEKMSSYFGSSEYIMICVLLQNAAHNAFHCVNSPTTEEAEKELYNIQSLLKALAEYYPLPHCYFEDWVYTEYSNILDGIAMSEELDEETFI